VRLFIELSKTIEFSSEWELWEVKEVLG